MDQSNTDNKKHKRLGDLLLEMGFINEEQLKEAVALAAEKHIKIGEALNELKAIDPDHIYWALGVQLNMDYLDLDPESIDHELVAEFSLEDLHRLKCLPLYRIGGVIHFAIVDPADKNLLQKIRDLAPDDTADFHLALPEKIERVLDYLGKHMPALLKNPLEIFPNKGEIRITEKSVSSDGEKDWNGFREIIAGLKEGEIIWIKRDKSGFRLWKKSSK